MRTTVFALVVTMLAEVAGATTPEEEALAALRARAEAWGEMREDLVHVCPSCRGTGKKWYSQRWHRCGTCHGSMTVTDTEKYRILHHDMRSRAFRTTMMAEPIGDGRKLPIVRRYRVVRTTLIDHDHGIAQVSYEMRRGQKHIYDGVTDTQRWIRDDGAWCLYDEIADGAWPGQVTGKYDRFTGRTEISVRLPPAYSLHAWFEGWEMTSPPERILLVSTAAREDSLDHSVRVLLDSRTRLSYEGSLDFGVTSVWIPRDEFIAIARAGTVEVRTDGTETAWTSGNLTTLHRFAAQIGVLELEAAAPGTTDR